jgi:hypothetical protein
MADCAADVEARFYDHEGQSSRPSSGQEYAT